MFLHRLHFNLRSREARATLPIRTSCIPRFAAPFPSGGRKCPEGEFLWRLEPETGPGGCPRVIVQGRSLPDWSRIGVATWFAKPPDPPIDLAAKLKLDSLQAGQRFRFRFRQIHAPADWASGKPCIAPTNRKRGSGKGCQQHGFSLPRLFLRGEQQLRIERYDVQVLQEQMLRGSRHDGGTIRVYPVLYDGTLTVTHPVQVLATLLGDTDKKINMGVGMAAQWVSGSFRWFNVMRIESNPIPMKERSSMVWLQCGNLEVHDGAWCWSTPKATAPTCPSAGWRASSSSRARGLPTRPSRWPRRSAASFSGSAKAACGSIRPGSRAGPAPTACSIRPGLHLTTSCG